MVRGTRVQQVTVSSDEEEVEDVDDGSDDDDNDDSQIAKGQSKKGRKRGSKGESQPASSQIKNQKKAKPSQRSVKVVTGPVLTLDEMVQNTLLYLLLMQHKKVPVKRSEIVKYAMNGQLASFPEVMEEIENILDKKFGINLVGIEEAKGRIKGYSSYILVSKYPMEATNCATTKSVEIDTKRSALYLVLSVVFMLGRSIEEDLIWKILTDLQLVDHLACKKREDLHKFLKQEYVSPMYLNLEEVKDTDQIEYRYSWGLRADNEFSKHAMLKFVAKQFPGRQASDFKLQYDIVKAQEKDVIETDLQGSGTEPTSHPHDEEDLEPEDSPSQSMNYANKKNRNGAEDKSHPEKFHSLSSRSTRDSLTTPPLPEDMETDTEDEPQDDDL